jgi:hypothetical protein
MYEKGTIFKTKVGDVSIDLSEIKNAKKNSWFINKIYKVTGPEELVKSAGVSNLGEVYLQCK